MDVEFENRRVTTLEHGFEPGDKGRKLWVKELQSFLCILALYWCLRVERFKENTLIIRSQKLEIKVVNLDRI